MLPSTITKAVARRTFATARLTAASLDPAQVQLRNGGFATRQYDSSQFNQAMQNDEVRSNLAYSLSYANDKSDFARNFSQLSPNERMKKQLEFSQDQLKHNKYNKCDNTPLPSTLEEALRPSIKRAIVVTEAKEPFKVFDVNKCWEELCGYTYLEAKGKSLGQLLQGPETDTIAATAMISQLLRGESEVGAELINYTKEGRKFRNRIRIGPLTSEVDGRQQVTHFVGVLQEVQQHASM